MTVSTARGPTHRRHLMSRSALCGVMSGLSALLPIARADAAPLYTGVAQVSAGGTAPSVAVNGNQTQVTLGAQRTLMDWSGFDVGAGDTVNFAFTARNGIVLNRITSAGPALIEGQVNGLVNGVAGGNIWFSSASGVIFGAGARVDAGGILATTASLDSARFLDAGQLQFTFEGSSLSQASINVDAGARLTGHGGLVALVGREVITATDSAVVSDGGGSVLYGGADNFQLRLAPGAAGDFDLVDFIIPDSGAGTGSNAPLDLKGATTGNSVFVAAVSRVSLGAVVNVEGLVTARTATAEGGDIVLSGGGGIVARQAGPSIIGAALTDIYLTAATASRDIQLVTNNKIFARPWVRPPKPPVVVEPEPEVEDPGEEEPCYECYYGNGGNGGNGSNGLASPLTFMDGAAIIDDGFSVASLAEPTFISSVIAGRDLKLTASNNIELGVARATRNAVVQGPSIRANSLGASGDLTVTSTVGDIVISAVGAGGTGVLTSASSIRLDQLGSGAGRFSVTARNNVELGDGSGAVVGAGPISLAAQNVFVFLAGTANIDSVTSSNVARLRAGSLNVGTVQAGRILLEAETVKAGALASGTDVYVFSSAGDATVTQARAGDDIFVGATGGTATLGSAALTPTALDAVSFGFVGNPDTLNGQIVSVRSTGGDARLGTGTGSVTGAERVIVEATRDAFVDIASPVSGLLSIDAGRDASFKAPTVTFDLVKAGRDIALFTSAGDFTSLQPLSAANSISLGASGALRVGDVRADRGSVTLIGSSVTAGQVSAAVDLTLRATGGAVQVASYRAGQDLILEGASLSLGSSITPVGRDLSITTPGAMNLDQDLAAGRNVTLRAGGPATVQNVTATTGAIQIAASALTTRTLTAAQAVTLDIGGQANLSTINAGSVRILANDATLGGTITAPTIQIESRLGPLLLGAASAAPATGMWIDNTEFGRLRAATAVNIYAGSTTGSARGDLTIGDLSITPASTPQVNIFAGGGRSVSVTGTVAPTVSGGRLRIGEPGGVWRPSSIFVTGALGVATVQGGAASGVRAFDDLRLIAVQDILMGSQRFIDLIRATPAADINIAQDKPGGVAPIAGEQGRNFIAAGRLEVSSDGKVVQQNTGSINQPLGLYLTGAASPALVIDPPQVVELFGSYMDGSGKTVTSFNAGGGVSYTVVDSAGKPTPPPAGATYRFNSCDVGTSSCSGASPLAASAGANSGAQNFQQANPLLRPPPRERDDDGGDGAAGVASAIANPPILLSVAAPEADAIILDPVVTGSGNEEIWRKRRAQK